jgi:hypothetical protein
MYRNYALKMDVSKLRPHHWCPTHRPRLRFVGCRAIRRSRCVGRLVRRQIQTGDRAQFVQAAMGLVADHRGPEHDLGSYGPNLSPWSALVRGRRHCGLNLTGGRRIGFPLVSPSRGRATRRCGMTARRSRPKVWTDPALWPLSSHQPASRRIGHRSRSRTQGQHRSCHARTPRRD